VPLSLLWYFAAQYKLFVPQNAEANSEALLLLLLSTKSFIDEKEIY